jgi:iron complex outermembrane recepter protein
MASSCSGGTPEIQAKSAVAVAVSTALSGIALPAQAQQDQPAPASGGIEEITVTATKREESMQDVAASIQAFTGADLKRQGITNMEDVVRFLPSVNHIGQTSGANKLIFRGVSDNPNAFIAASSAALYIDEQPLTQFAVNPEPRLIDIERVEALAGPQGTLYGDSAQSGTLRIITNKPDPSAFEGAAEMMLRSGGDSEASYDVNAVLNIPLVEDKFAIRIVGFTARDGGFIDNVLGTSPMQGTKDNSDLVQKDINRVDFTGGRVSAKWFVNDDWAITGALISQKSEAEGLNDYDPTVGDLQTVKFYKDTRDDDWWQASLTFEGMIGNIEFVSNTSYFDRKLDYQFDRTQYSAYFNYNFCTTTDYYNNTVVYAPAYCWSGQTIYDQDTTGFNTQHQKNDRFTQEIRLSQAGDNYRWVLGAFYEKKNEQWAYRARTPEFLDSLSYYYWTGLYAASGTDPSWWLSADDTEWTQWALFGNYNYEFNEHWSGELGIRYFDQKMDRIYYVDKPFITAPGVWPDVTHPTGSQNDYVAKVGITYTIDDDKMVYALYNEGFRAGGANRNRVDESLTIFPLVYQPDKLENFEVGTKTRWADGRVQLNATAFFGQWSNYQIETLDPSFQPCGPGESNTTDPCNQPFQVVVANVGDAQQTGLEMELKAAPDDNWDLGLNASYIVAETSEEFVVTDEDRPVPKGSRLPNVPKLKLGVYAQYSWPVRFGSDGEAYVRGQYTYQGDSVSQLEAFKAVSVQEAQASGGTLSPSAREQFLQPSYGIGDIRFGVATSSWTIEGFVNNVGDERAVLYNDDLYFDPFFGKRRVTTNRPREYGIKLSYNWQ